MEMNGMQRVTENRRAGDGAGRRRAGGGLRIVREQRLSSGGGGTSSKVLVGAGSTLVAPLISQLGGDYVKSPAA